MPQETMLDWVIPCCTFDTFSTFGCLVMAPYCHVSCACLVTSEKKTRAMSGVQTLSLLISYLLSVICYLYELPCKIWSLYLKKLVRYCTKQKRGYLSYVFFILLVLCLQVIIQSKLLSSFVGSLDNYTPLLIMK